MKHVANANFWQLFAGLPVEVQTTAKSCYQLLRDDPKHPSLHFKKVGAYWSARVGRKFRAVARESDDGYVWFWIGSHADYDKLVG